MKNKFIIIFFVLAILFFVVYHRERGPAPRDNIFLKNNNPTVIVNNYIFNTEVVKFPEDVKRGLSGRANLADNEAMLFVFSEKGERTFWMKDMNFNIDLLWIDDDQIVAFEQNMQHFDNPPADYDLPVYNSPQEVDKVLEIQSGLVDELNIKIGDIIKINI
jgi:uncharacterized protein